MAATVSHDLNNIFSIIMNYASFVSLELPPQFANLRGDLDEIRKAAQRGVAIARNIHHRADDRQIPRPGAFDLNRFITERAEGLLAPWKDAIDLKLRLAAELPAFEMDPAQFSSIMDRILRFPRPRPGRRRVTVETRVREIAPGFVAEQHPVKEGRYVSFEFTDAGREIPDVAGVLRPHHEYGYSIIYSTVKHFHGYFWVYSEPGMGTAYKFLFPVLFDAAPEPEAKVVPHPSRKTVLLVENEESVRNVVARLLGELGYRVLAADCAAAARRVAEEHGDEIRALVVDAILPDGNARDLVRALAPRRDYPALYISGYSAVVLQYHGILEDGDAFLSKPFGRGELAGVLARLTGADA